MGEAEGGNPCKGVVWPKWAHDLVHANEEVAGAELKALINKLEAESGNPRWACWRFVRRHGIRSNPEVHDNPPRRELRWSKAARDLVRANMNAAGTEVSDLVSRLSAETGNPRWACRRFVRSMGIRWKRSYRHWTEQEQQRLLKLIDLHPVNEISKLLRRSESSIWHMLQRLGANAKMGRDSFTKYTLAVALHVRPETVERWIVQGWLKAREVESGGGKRIIIEAEDFCEFCRDHTRDVVGNRLTRERLEFVYRFAFPPSHAELLPVRESKKERLAYKSQLDDDVESEPAEFAPDRVYDVDDPFEGIA